MIRMFTWFIASFLLVSSITAQDNSTTASDIVGAATEVMDQDNKFKMGDMAYTAKPKNAWELGLHLGHFFIDGDVDRRIPGGYGLGLHLRKSLNYVFSFRFDLMFGSAKGLDPQPSGNNLTNELFDEGRPVFDGYGPDNPWFFAHKTRYSYGAIQGIFNVGNILFHNKNNKWNVYTGAGIGLDFNKTMLDLRNENGQVYTNLVSGSGFTEQKFNTKSGRADIKDALDNIYDGDYETEAFQKHGIYRRGDSGNIHVNFQGIFGVARKFSNRFNLGLEHQVMLSDNDYLDGQKWRTNIDQTNNADIGHYTNLRLAINLGSLDNKTEPLYWLNPLDATFNDIADLKRRPILDLTDEDGDGVIDMMDQELDTPAGCAVDTRGVTLDSDGDGLPDCKDDEPYSPPGFSTDDVGVAKIPEIDHLDEGDVMRIINENCPGCKQVAVETGCGEWFLPMIHFDSDKSAIKPEFYSHLHHVATVMKQCPEVCVTVQGHTDSKSNNEYNTKLSYKRAQAAIDYLTSTYGIDRSRLKLMYGGEENPLVTADSSDAKRYMNRRVEFRLCTPSDTDMGMPAGVTPETGSTGGERYRGNKSSGY